MYALMDLQIILLTEWHVTAKWPILITYSVKFIQSILINKKEITWQNTLEYRNKIETPVLLASKRAEGQTDNRNEWDGAWRKTRERDIAREHVHVSFHLYAQVFANE
jgi:hypothetical protein